MPLKAARNQGTNADGTTNNMYCSNCFEGGVFKQPDWTVNQMQEFVKQKMKEMGFPGFLTGMFTKGIPKLRRWSR